MSVTQHEIDSFHCFASEKLQSDESVETIDELFELWRMQNPTPEVQADIRAAIARGLADVDAGRYRPADEVMDELRAKHGIPSE